ncbi:unnamed protein product, partial [Ilex paraguariensis]
THHPFLTKEHNKLVSEHVMEDQQIPNIEVQVGSLAFAQEKLLKELHDMFLAMNSRFDQLESNHVRESGDNSINRNWVGKLNGQPGSGQTSSTNLDLPKLVKLDFPR